MSACQKLLSEPHLPNEHRPRVENNYKIYMQAFQKFQEQVAQQQKDWAEKVSKNVNKTTLDIDPKKVAVTL
jgi:hypothetical protein